MKGGRLLAIYATDQISPSKDSIIASCNLTSSATSLVVTLQVYRTSPVQQARSNGQLYSHWDSPVATLLPVLVENLLVNHRKNAFGGFGRQMSSCAKQMGYSGMQRSRRWSGPYLPVVPPMEVVVDRRCTLMLSDLLGGPTQQFAPVVQSGSLRLVGTSNSLASRHFPI